MVVSWPFFASMAWNFFLNLQTWHISKRGKKNWGTLTFEYCLKVNELKTMIFFWAISGFWGQIFLWNHLGRATNFYMMVVTLIKNSYLKFEGIAIIFIATMNKKLLIFRFRGPFWAFWVPHNSPTIMILVFPISYIMKYPELWIQHLAPISVPNFSQKYPKIAIFGCFFFGPFLIAPT